MSTRARVLVAVALSLLVTAGCGTDGQDGRPRSAPAPGASSTVSPQPPGGGTASPGGPGQPGRSPGAAPSRPPTGGKRYGPLGTTRLTGNRHVALTFDDGPHPLWTPKILDQLRAAGVKATFCLVGVKARKYPALVARMVREGHSLCNHSWSHDLKLGRKPVDQIRADLIRTNEAIRRAAPGVSIPYYRQPGGMWTPQVVATVKQLGMVPLHWDVDPQDWEKPGATLIIKRVLGHARPGSIILLHDGGGDRSGTTGACPRILTSLKARYGITRLG
ncbi:MAG TPA: polysaccharide deacetylase family protein [Micromonospora sp.]